MVKIQLSNTDYPIRFDMRALKEFKSLTGGQDVLKGFDARDSDVLTALAYTSLKSGFYQEQPNAKETPFDLEQISRVIELKELHKVLEVYKKDIEVLTAFLQGETPNTEHSGEASGTS